MTGWLWIGVDAALALHDRQLAEHGGPSGVRDQGMLESALARPVNQAAYGEPTIAALAAAYAFGLARNHAFVDGNKRIAWVVARTFLAVNGTTLAFDKADALATVLALAAGELSQGNWPTGSDSGSSRRTKRRPGGRRPASGAG